MWGNAVAATRRNRPRPRFGSAAVTSLQVQDVRTSARKPWQHHEILDDEDDDEGRGRLMLPDQSFVRLNVIHVPYDVVVLHLDCVNLLRVTLDNTFTANISGNP
jgi:hypothetical protein